MGKQVDSLILPEGSNMIEEVIWAIVNTGIAMIIVFLIVEGFMRYIKRK
jgi:heme/copper-type cytochrome/quinol oxidase subunit 2